MQERINKKILSGKEGREKVLSGINQVADAVKSTLGAKGRNVLMEVNQHLHHISKDGVTVASSINLEDPVENMGAQLVKQAAAKTVTDAGDATTTSSVLTQAITNLGNKKLEEGISHVEIIKGIEKAKDAVVKNLKENSKKVSTHKVLKQVATISANNDSDLGKIIADTFSKVGLDGVVTIEESSDTETTSEVSEGMKVDGGFANPYFVTNSEKMVSEMEKPLILIYNGIIKDLKGLKEILSEICIKNKRELLIVCNEINGEALATLIKNHVERVIKVCAVQIPLHGNARQDIMEDIASVVGGRVLSEARGDSLMEISESDFGSCKKTKVDNNSSLFMEGFGDKEYLKSRINDLKVRKQTELVRNRVASLSNGIAVIKVGGTTSTEVKEKKDRADDALCAVIAAIEEGINIGGGAALLKASKCLSLIKPSSKEEAIGIEIVSTAIKEPFKQILKNGAVYSDKLLNTVLNGDDNLGYDISIDKTSDMFASGIVDPTKVIRSALENATSVGKMFLSMEYVIYNK